MDAVWRNKVERDNRKAKLELENSRRQEELIRKQEEEERKKKEKEMHRFIFFVSFRKSGNKILTNFFLDRLKVFEQYQKKKAEQEALEQGGGTMSASSAAVPTPKPAQRTARGHSQPPGRQTRPISQVVIGKVAGFFHFLRFSCTYVLG